MYKLLYCVVLYIVAIINPNSAWAWGVSGHKFVVLVAQKYITQDINNTLNSIVSPSKLTDLAIYPDTMKHHNDAYFHWSFDCNSRFCKQQKVKWETTKNWHYSNVDENFIRIKDAYPLPSLLDDARNILKFSNDRRLQKNAITWLLHLVADIHQPLHVGGRKTDKGNAIIVWYKGDKTNLHRLWDTDLVHYMFGGAKLPFKKFNYEVDIAATIDNATQIAKRIYKDSPTYIDQHYMEKNGVVVHTQLMHAGYVVASILNDALADCCQ